MNQNFPWITGDDHERLVQSGGGGNRGQNRVRDEPAWAVGAHGTTSMILSLSPNVAGRAGRSAGRRDEVKARARRADGPAGIRITRLFCSGPRHSGFRGPNDRQDGLSALDSAQTQTETRDHRSIQGYQDEAVRPSVSATESSK